MSRTVPIPPRTLFSRHSLDSYGIRISPVGTEAVAASMRRVRLLAEQMNKRRDVGAHLHQAVRACDIYAMLLIDEVSSRVIQVYLEQKAPDASREALDGLRRRLGEAVTMQTMRSFVEWFPPDTVYQHMVSAEEYLSGDVGGTPNEEVALIDMIRVWLANENPAMKPLIELVDVAPLRSSTAYDEIIAALRVHFEGQPPVGPKGQNLLDMLRGPALAVPNSLMGQLRFIQSRWGFLLGDYVYQILLAIDLIREEHRPRFAGPAAGTVLAFDGAELDPENYSLDRDWMPRLILLAKNVYVWMDQLSKKFKRPIIRLDDIPVEALLEISQRGFTGLWLIGIWERSAASARIKQMLGNPEAVASAYSIYDYEIAQDLGGEPAYQRLRERAVACGIRLASDMVPNHMGIDSRWVIQHPDWFVSLDDSPYPSYTFDGPDLCADDRVGIYLEDHYYDHSDAAVVFKRRDLWTGDERYVYHGNDGTSMPWNDTAQLDYTKPDVREAVIETVLRVAKKFPIIRFDAAMTLTRKHYQRLWFPKPGHGGGIPSRAEHSLTQQKFDALMPAEFWREVVDRVHEESPDTLLLAEAFWLMEGYFVRTLGMHRVYNSAFMNMLRDEDNAGYRATVKNTLRFDPQILKRYVNFMSNPDERTAVDQFGAADKYFGVCTLMITMPGLPMFGHGQIEGFTEKYGMEFRKAHWDETPDQALVERHQREVFPLLRRRVLFADVTNFLLYDFHMADDRINEDVYAYSNRLESERVLVVYHNRYAETDGRIREAVPYAVRQGANGAKELRQSTLVEGLDIVPSPDRFVLFRDQASGLEYIRNSQDLATHGLRVALGAYQCHVFLGFQEVQGGRGGAYAELADQLQDRGVPSLERALSVIYLAPIHDPFRELVRADLSREIARAWLPVSSDPRRDARSQGAECSVDQFRQRALLVLEGIYHYQMQTHSDAACSAARLAGIADDMSRQYEAICSLPYLDLSESLPAAAGASGPVKCLRGLFVDGAAMAQAILVGWLCTHALERVAGSGVAADRHCIWYREWLLDDVLMDAFQQLGLDESASQRAMSAIRIMTCHPDWYKVDGRGPVGARAILTEWLADEAVEEFLQFNRFEEVLWFNKESFDQLCCWMHVAAAIEIIADASSSPGEKHDALASAR